MLKTRNYQGKSLVDLIFEAGTYEFMEVRVIEAAIGLSWVGKQNFDGKLLETSTSYKLLFQFSVDQKQDNEAKLRVDGYSLDRKVLSAESYNPHAFSFLGVFTRMKVLYNLEQIVLFLLITVYHMFLLMLYMMLHDSKATMKKFMEAMMMDNMSVMTPDEMKELRDLFDMFPSVWKNLLLSQTWCLLVPIILINRFAYAKLT